MADGLHFPKIGLISWKLLFTTKKKDISESVFYIKSLNDIPLFSHSTQTANGYDKMAYVCAYLYL